MGFGLLFIGYLLTFLFSLNSFGFIFRLLGYALMASSLIRLRDYEPRFKYPFCFSFILILTSISDFISEGAAKLDIVLPAFISSISAAVVWVELIASFAFNLTLLYSIAVLARRLGLNKQSGWSIRNMVPTGIYFILEIIGMGPLSGNTSFIKYFGLLSLIIMLVWIILNLVLIFSCYMYICPAGDEDMPKKKTGIGFIDKIREESDRRMENAKKETTDYYVNKQTSKPKGKKKNKK